MDQHFTLYLISKTRSSVSYDFFECEIISLTHLFNRSLGWLHLMILVGSVTFLPMTTHICLLAGWLVGLSAGRSVDWSVGLPVCHNFLTLHFLKLLPIKTQQIIWLVNPL